MLTRVAKLVVGILLLQLPASAIAQAHARRSVAVPPQILEHIWQDTTMASWFVDVPRDSLAALLDAEPVDLNGDGVPELVIRGRGRICGANNCVFWIFGRTSTGYERLLGDGSIQSLQRLSTVTHGYRDVRTWMHGSAWESGVILYKFDGRRYRAARCADYNYSYLDSHDERHELKRPRVTPEPCPPD